MSSAYDGLLESAIDFAANQIREGRPFMSAVFRAANSHGLDWQAVQRGLAHRSGRASHARSLDTSREAYGEIKALETVHNGYKFRSRLEARWSVALDVLGIDYDYEAQGYDLGEIGWYLPDFWLKAQRAWLEVKNPAAMSRCLEKCLALARGSGRDVIVVGEIPKRKQAAQAHKYSSDGGMVIGSLIWRDDESGDGVFDVVQCLGENLDCDPFAGYHWDFDKAFDAARQARFEGKESNVYPHLRLKNGRK